MPGIFTGVTFSIVACDLETPSGPEWGVAVASKFLAVGSLVPSARAGAGAVATQALANASYGPRGVDLLDRGRDADSVMHALVDADPDRDQRQLGLVDPQGRAATFTGAGCLDWAGGKSGEGYCCQGNVLSGARVVDEMVAAFVNTEGELAHRLLEALRAGNEAGGDARGMQSAAILVVREGGGYLGLTDRVVDLRADDHPEAISELHRIFEVHQLYFPRAESLSLVDIDGRLAAELHAHLTKLGYSSGPEETGYGPLLKEALFEYVGMENLEQRWSDEAKVESGVLEHLRRTAEER
ncbi:DUF1028 domain-containing protein [soil metagenome]